MHAPVIADDFFWLALKDVQRKILQAGRNEI